MVSLSGIRFALACVLGLAASPLRAEPAPTATPQPSAADLAFEPASPAERAEPAPNPSERESPRDAVVHAAPERERFGLVGQVALSGGLNVGISNLAFSASDAARFDVVVTPSADYFIVEDFSLGGFVSVQYRQQTTYVGSALVKTKTTGFGFGLRAGYNWSFGPSFSLWPRAAFVFATWHITQRLPSDTLAGGLAEETGVTEREFDEMSLAVNVYVPLLIHPVPHFFLGIGPELTRDLVREVGEVKNEATLVGFASTVGGWF